MQCDIVGTGGDSHNTFNISTTSSIIASSLLYVAKHGNKASTSKSGSADAMEALAHYLRHQTLITRDEAQARVPEAVPLTHLDYLWGVFDLSGEMMRFATVATARTGRMAGGVGGRSILGDLQELRYRLETLPEIPTKEYRGKMEVMRQSVQKVEKLGYGLVVRGSERPRGWLPDMKDDAAGAVEPV
mgnify:CR=1 FL=1